jgi:AcrR family transcriptional regulator
VVALGVVGPDHGRVARGQDRPAEPGEVGRPAGQRPPGEAGAPPVGGVVDQVDGIGLAVGVEVVAGTDPRVESLRARRRRRTAEAIVAGASELFEERGFERTTIDQIADAAEISRRTFFRYFADKEEVFFAEDERLLAVIDETLDGARDGEPVLDLARRATRALAAHSAADPGRRLAHERLIAATPALQARRMAKTLRWEQAIAARLVARGSSEQEALLVPKVALACFQTAYERWVRDPGQDLPALVDDSFTYLSGLTG